MEKTGALYKIELTEAEYEALLASLCATVNKANTTTASAKSDDEMAVLATTLCKLLGANEFKWLNLAIDGTEN